MKISFDLSRRTILWGVVAVLACTGAYVLSDTLTFTTYYPSPYGVYANIMTTSNTFLATTGGGVGIGTKTPAAGAALDVEPGPSNNNKVVLMGGGGSVGIGKTPGAGTALDVNGMVNAGNGLKMGAIPAGTSCDGSHNGLIGFNTDHTKYQYCDGSNWKDLGGATASVITLSGSNPTCPGGTTMIDKYYSPAASCSMVAYVPACWYCTVNTTVDWWSNGGGIGTFGGNVACLSNQWSQVKCYVPLNCTGSTQATTISGTNPTCPDGYYSNGMKYWSAQACTGSCGTNYYSNYTYCPGSCTTSAGWTGDSGLSCTYTSCSSGSTIRCGTETCTPMSWTQIQCLQAAFTCQ